MGSIVTIPQTVRFGVMQSENKFIIGHDGCVYGFGEAPEMTYSFEDAQWLYNKLINEGHTHETITLFMYSPDSINDSREPFPVDEEYYTRDVIWHATNPGYKDFVLTSENH